MRPSSRTNIPAERPSALSFGAARESRGDISALVTVVERTNPRPSELEGK
jgi:hypothetical protein